MSVRLTCCGKCGMCDSAFRDTIDRLQQEHPDDLRVVQLKCMAACKQAPAVMIDYDFYPNVTPEELEEHINEKLTSTTPLYDETSSMEVDVS